MPFAPQRAGRRPVRSWLPGYPEQGGKRSVQSQQPFRMRRDFSAWSSRSCRPAGPSPSIWALSFQLLGLPLRREEQEEGGVWSSSSRASHGSGRVAARKDRETVSGDGGTYQREDGTLYVLLWNGREVWLPIGKQFGLRLLEPVLGGGGWTRARLHPLNSRSGPPGRRRGKALPRWTCSSWTCSPATGHLQAGEPRPTWERARRSAASPPPPLPAGLEQRGAAVPDRTPIHLSRGTAC